MNNNTYSISVIVAATLVITPLSISKAAEPEISKTNPKQATRIQKVLALKSEAMKLPGMRSENGNLGKQVEALMDEIAASTTGAELSEARSVASADIHAKILLWATDRKERLADYQKFAKAYLNRPATDAEAMEYFYRKDPNAEHDPFADNTEPRFPPREGTWAPKPVSEDDAIELNRLMMEYSYFMPPTGQDFDHAGTRYNIAKAIRSIGNIKTSKIVFETDWKIWIELSKNMLNLPKSGGQKILQNQICIDSIRANPDAESYELLSEGMANEKIKSVIRNQFSESWKLAFTFRDRRREIYQNYESWIALAKQEWREPRHQEFARLLLSISPPQNP